jgi:molecular chaperone GrpE
MRKKNKTNCENDEKIQDQSLNEDTENQEQVVDEKELLEQEVKTLKDNALRQMAEFDNYRKRTQKEKADIYNDAIIKTVAGIISTMDNFERALEIECSDQEYKKGMSMIFSQLSEHIKCLGVVEIEALNQQFNPEFHNAINKIEDGNFGENTVCQVFLKGYKLGEKVIRHAMVVVAN